VERQRIVDAIKRIASENGGTPPGQRQIEAAIGLRPSEWRGVYWAKWGDAVAEAGFARNSPLPRTESDTVLSRVAALVRRIGRIPTHAELMLERRTDRTFPSHQVVRARLGGKVDQARLLADYCKATPGWDDVVALLAAMPSGGDARATDSPARQVGEVYLIRMGRDYKIGRTDFFARRRRELAIQLPARADTVHVIETDDPVGVERYWHMRFAAKRKNGEWFALTEADVAAFKMWRRIC
jgi:hypothetical protein